VARKELDLVADQFLEGVAPLPDVQRLVPKTVNPAWARAAALAQPISEEPPVMRAVFPECAFIAMLQAGHGDL
jgi:hypothetical protein